MIHIITKSTCPFCIWAKEFLNSLGKKYQEIEISWDPEAYKKYQEISGMWTVPQIFDGEIKKENLIGGYSELLTKHRAGEIFQN